MLFFIVLVYLFLQIYWVVEDIVIICVLPVINHLLPAKRKIISNLEERRNLTSLIKVLLSYFQITLLITKIDIPLPFEVNIQSFNNADPNQLIYSLDCALIPVSKLLHIPLIYVRFICETSFPVILFIIFYLRYKLSFRKNRHYIKIGWTSAFMVIWLLFIPSLYKSIIGLSDCRMIGNRYYISRDMTLRCFT